MRQRRADLAVNDSAQRLTRLGIQVFFGDAAFTSAREIAVGSQTLRFTRAAIATGSRPAVPPIDGLSDTPYLTNETVFDLTERPDRLLVIGGGAIGCELSQAFARLGSRVTVFDQARRVLANDDPDAVRPRAARPDQRWRAVRAGHGHHPRVPPQTARRSCISAARLMARRSSLPGIACWSLPGARRTSRGSTWRAREFKPDPMESSSTTGSEPATGACTPPATSAPDSSSRTSPTPSARIVIQNALFFGRRRASALTIPWCTYTDPEVAHVGLSAEDAEKRRPDVQTISVPLSDVDRAVLDDEAQGFVRVHHDRGRLLGCTIVAAHAGEMIGQAS